jgi:hypothetical protein
MLGKSKNFKLYLIMKTLEEEAQEYFDNNIFCDGITPFEEDISKKCFIGGANSKWVQAEIIRAQIEIIDDSLHDGLVGRVDKRRKLYKKLNELQNEK